MEFKEYGMYTYDENLFLITKITEDEIIGIRYNVEDYFDYMEEMDEEETFDYTLTEDNFTYFLYENFDQIDPMCVFKIYLKDMSDALHYVGAINEDHEFRKILRTFSYNVLGIK